MQIRTTESRIPGGFTKANAEKLGEASNLGGPNQEFIIVAYYSSPVQAGIELPFWNKYVAFVDETKVSGNLAYEWTIKFKKNNGDLVHQSGATGVPIIMVDAKNFTDPNIVLQAAKVEVSLKIPSISSTPVTLVQNLQGLSQNIENFLAAALVDTVPRASAGNPFVTREVANRIKPYLSEAGSAYGKELDIPANLTGALAYLNILIQDNKEHKHHLFPSTLLENAGLSNAINNNAQYDFFEKAPPALGICPIRPHLLAMYLPKNANPDIDNISATGPGYATYTPYQVIDGNAVTGKTVFDAFMALPPGEKADIYNQLRFPKSNIRLCAFLLHQLKKTYSTWAGLTKDEFKNGKDCAKALVSELLTGKKDAGSFNIYSLAPKVHPTGYSTYMQKILEAQPAAVQYETVRIKVLDVRSGRPIKNARVKRLIIDASGHRIGATQIDFDANATVKNAEHAFSYNPDYKTSYSLEKRAQIALNELGFYVGNPDGALGQNSETQYERYWNSRVLDGSFDVSERENGNLPKKHLQSIIDEYLNFRETDENGVLTIRIPLNLFLNRTIKLEVGFWEFPVTVERRKHQQQTSQLIRSAINPNTEADTDFSVRWIDNQESGWNSGNPDAEHFGWHVENPQNSTTRNLKVNEILDIKTQTTGNAVQTNILSFFFDPVVYPFHFVLFGMQWCQPVWDGIALDADYLVGRSTSKSFLNRKDQQGKWIKNLNLHIVSKCYGGNITDRVNEPKNYGQYYGFYDRKPNNHKYRSGGVHDGVDIYTGPTGKMNCFAVHGGKVANLPSVTGYGKCVRLDFSYWSENKHFLYAHLDSLIDDLNSKIVIAGCKLGITGRTGSAFSDDNEPSHLHFQFMETPNGYSSSREPFSYLFEKDQVNAEIIPGNKLPLMLPCQCKYGNAPGRNPINCKAGNELISRDCWALIKYPDYDYRSSRSLNNIANYHEFPDKNSRLNNILWFACPYIHKKPKTKLINNLSATGNETEIEVMSTADFPTSGFLLIQDELIKYGKIDGNKFKSCIRASGNTIKATHSSQSEVSYLNSATYWIQAHLRFIFENKNQTFNGFTIPNKDYYNPGIIGNSLPVLVSELDLNAGDKVEITSDSRHMGKLIKVQKDGKEGWIRSNLVDSNNIMLKTVKNTPGNPGETSIAIYFFREEEFSIQEFNNYKKNFEIDTEVIKKLRSYMIEIPNV